MAPILKTAWRHGFKLYFAFCLFTFTLLILLINATRVFADEASNPPVKAPADEIKTANTTELPRSLFHWTLSPSNPQGFQETYVEFRGNKMFLKVRF